MSRVAAEMPQAWIDYAQFGDSVESHLRYDGNLAGLDEPHSRLHEHTLLGNERLSGSRLKSGRQVVAILRHPSRAELTAVLAHSANTSAVRPSQSSWTKPEPC